MHTMTVDKGLLLARAQLLRERIERTDDIWLQANLRMDLTNTLLVIGDL